MPISAHDAFIALLVRGLANLKTVLHKAEAHCDSGAASERALLHARLADDMNDLTVQVHWAAAGSKTAVDRLLGRGAPPAAPGEAAAFKDLYAQVDDALAHLNAVDAAALEAGLAHSIELPRPGGGVSTLSGARFVLEFAIPNFFFHATAAYAILRAAGVPLTKGDFMGRMG